MNYIGLINEFGKPKAKIDFITLALPSSIKSPIDALHFEKNIESRGNSINVSTKWRGPQDEWITIHDPSLQTLQFLLDEYCNIRILSLEIALDFKLNDGSNDPVRLRELHSWLKTSLFPQRHELMQTGRRKFYEKSSNKIKRDTLETSSSDKTIYWTDSWGREQEKWSRLFEQQSEYFKWNLC